MSEPFRIILTFLIGIIVFILLPLIGWGLDDITGFFSLMPRIMFVSVVLFLNGYAAYKIPEVGKPKNKGIKYIPRQHFTVIFLQIISILLVLSAPFCDRRKIITINDYFIIRYIGIVLYVFGFLLMHFIEAYLGIQFSLEVTIQENHNLLTEGPFKFIRHPRYLGIMIFTLGISLTFTSVIAVMLSTSAAIVLLWRIHDEEILMNKEFGVKWEDYKQKTWKLIPFVF